LDISLRDECAAEFFIAMFFVGLWKSPPAVAAMLCAVGTFILLYATLTSLEGPLADENHVLPRSLKLGAKIRAGISGLSLLLLPAKALAFVPDFWCGFISFALANSLFKAAGVSSNFFDPGVLNVGFAPVYITCVLEGFILSFLLLMISFFAVMFVQARDRKRVFAVTDPR
jgi:hypothetical protein